MEGWLIGRYRKYYRQFLLPQNKSIQLIISETGIDNSPCGSPNLGGWQNYCNWWLSHGYTTNCNQYFTDMLAWYDENLLQKDAYVLGATIFQLEIAGSWQSYDISPALDNIISYMNNTS